MKARETLSTNPACANICIRSSGGSWSTRQDLEFVQDALCISFAIRRGIEAQHSSSRVLVLWRVRGDIVDIELLEK